MRHDTRGSCTRPEVRANPIDGVKRRGYQAPCNAVAKQLNQHGGHCEFEETSLQSFETIGGNGLEKKNPES